MSFADPRNDRAVFETDDQLHSHRHLAANAVDDANQIGILPARRHEIDQAGDASGRFDLGLEDQSVAAITAARRFDFIRGQETPAAIFFVAEQRRETGA